MSQSTSLRCPQCGHSTLSDKGISSGASVRCARCNSVFRFDQSARGLAEAVPAVTGRDARLQELFAAEDKPKTSVRSREIDIRVPDELIERLPPRTTGPPAASKKIVVDHKPLPFHGPRAMMAGVLIAVAGLAFYGFSRWYVDTVISLDTSASLASAKRVARVKDLTGSLGKVRGQPQKTAGAADGTSTPQSTVHMRTVAPATAQIGDMVVGVSIAQIGSSNGTSDGEYLTLTLRITNLSEKPITYVSWSAPIRKAVLSDQNHNYYNRVGATPQADQVIQPDLTITDTIQFEKPSPGVVLYLDLPHGNQKFDFSLPPSFVQRIQVTTTAPKAVAPAPAPPPVSVAASVSEQPYSAERDPQIIADVNEAYKGLMARVEKRATGMTSNNAIRFRRTEKDKIIKGLSEKMDMTPDQIRRMIKSP
jgi:hypothetical protein